MNAAAPSVGLGVENGSVDIFGSEAGIVKALATLRQAPLAPEEKGRLRNLFLSYTGEADDTKRETLKKEILTSLEEQPQLSSLLGVKKEPVAPVMNILGRTRPAPSFNSVVQTTAVPTDSIASEPIAPQTPVTPPAEPVVTEASVVPPPMPQEVPAPTVVEPMPVPEPAAPAPTPEPVAAPVTDANAKVRIDAIKRDINSRVGNPVNLINADEVVGREYMSALLNAMKQASIGGATEALTRLDTAYQAALKLINEKGLGTNRQVPEPKNEVVPPVPEPPPIPEVIEEVPAPPPPTEPAPEIKPPPPPPVQSEGLYHRPADELDQTESLKKEETPSFASRFSKTDEKNVDEKPAEVAQTISVRKIETSTTPIPEPEKLKPLKDTATTLPEKMADLKAAAVKREAEAKKPITDLKSPEVESGLRQLLSEWSLFKKSGFLGTGPSGMDHPLYKQLSGLPMAAVVSGRFEGVTPEIKRQLSDYMTGWRYEQGIMHEMGETFDNYLRRVIRQVLEKQRIQSSKES